MISLKFLKWVPSEKKKEDDEDDLDEFDSSDSQFKLIGLILNDHLKHNNKVSLTDFLAES